MQTDPKRGAISALSYNSLGLNDYSKLDWVISESKL